MEINKLFIEQKLLLESDILGYLQHNPNCYLVNEDGFIAYMVNINRFNMIGMNTFLRLLNLDYYKYIESIKKLAKLNYGNYLTSDVYGYLKEQINCEMVEKNKKEYTEKLIELLTSKFLETGSQEWKYNNDLVRQLLKANNIQPDTQDRIDYLVVRACTYNFSIEHPDEYKGLLNDLAKRIRMRTYVEDGEVFFETYFEEK